MSDPKIRIKRSSVQGKIPTPEQLPIGELALNTYDGILFSSKNVGVGTCGLSFDQIDHTTQNGIDFIVVLSRDFFQ